MVRFFFQPKETAMKEKGNRPLQLSLGTILLAGLCGGTAEMMWVAVYSAVTPVSGIEIARQVTASVFASADSPLAPLAGVGIHLALSLALALAFVRAVWAPFAPRLGVAGSVTAAVAALGAVWAVNFFLVLTVLNPGFVSLMPYPVTLISKALFGLAMAWALNKEHSGKRAIGAARTNALRAA
jgi:hypothetical protein